MPRIRWSLFLLLLTTSPVAWGEIVRGIYCSPGPAVDNRVWADYRSGYASDESEKHSGKASLRCSNDSDQEAHGAVQLVRFDQQKPRPLVVAGWAKLEGVSGKADYHCSVYLDLRLQGGKSWPMKIAAFDPAKKGWQYSERVYHPPAPIESARVYVFLRERAGTAWFDDIYVGEVREDGTRSPNRLRDPSLEGELGGTEDFREPFFATLKSLGCDAFHFYRHVSWQQVMGEDPQRAPERVPSIDSRDPLLDFVRDAHRRGFKVWLTVGLGAPLIRDGRSPEFPFLPCVNNRWGTAYTRALAYMAQYGVDGLGMVPDEWNYDNSRVRSLAKHQDPEVARFYAELPGYCDCPVCRKRFRETTGLDYPDVRHAWRTADPVWAQFTRFRYDSTTAWIRRSVAAVHGVNPKAVTDTMICVLPVCSDNRLATGAAWDDIGADTGLDCLQTDPYIQLHNYLGDSTHYYPTETTIHLEAANWKRRAGVTLEACRLRDKYRPKRPVEVYGAALSCLMHGAREFFWWHMNFVEGKAKWVDARLPRERVRAAYQVMRAMEPVLANARPPGEVLVVYSRRSEDTWHWLAGLPADERKRVTALHKWPEQVATDRRRGFTAHRNLLYWLLRRGCPFRTTFIEHPDPQRLQAAEVLLVPFPFALTDAESDLLKRQAAAGKTVVLMSELSPVDEWGQWRRSPSTRQSPLLLMRWFRRWIDYQSDGEWRVPIGRGEAIFLGGDFAVRLFEPQSPMKDPKGTVPLPSFAPQRTSQLAAIVDKALGHPASLFARQPDADVEAALARGPEGRTLLLINWESAATEVLLQSRWLEGARSVRGYAISAASEVRALDEGLPSGNWRVRLAAQEAILLELRSGPLRAWIGGQGM